MVGARIALAALVSLAVWMAGCEDNPDNQRVLTTAYAGPMTLSLHAEISPKSAVVATVSHGEKLEVLGRRRRFVRVRTSKGAIGWTDTIRLLSAGQKESMDELAERAQRLPSHGAATVFDALNVHTEPNRQAPSFHQIREGELVDVILYQTLPRVTFQNPNLFPPRPKPASAGKGKESKKASDVPPPPHPPAPKPPADWVEISRRRPAEPDPEVLPLPAPDPKKPEKPKLAPQDDWALVRLPNGRAGWVLVRALRMHIPDEVAQYSEGARITSYFAMAEHRDGDRVRHDWLWTTLSDTQQPWQFDGFRYFIWNTRRHRYETSYVQSGLRGYFPVETRPVDVQSGRKREAFPGFVLIMEEDGVRYRKTYAFQQYRVVLVSKEPYTPQETAQPEDGEADAEPTPAAVPKDGWLAPIKKLKQKVFGN